MNLDYNTEEDESQIPELMQNLKDIGKNQKDTIMRTPCNHYYHVKCLISVMHYKMKCAVCRATLPAWY